MQDSKFPNIIACCLPLYADNNTHETRLFTLQKTKPTQHSVRELRALGLTPDLLVCRSSQVSFIWLIENLNISITSFSLYYKSAWIFYWVHGYINRRWVSPLNKSFVFSCGFLVSWHVASNWGLVCLLSMTNSTEKGKVIIEELDFLICNFYQPILVK